MTANGRRRTRHRRFAASPSAPLGPPPSSISLDRLEPAHIRLQRVRHRDRAALLLIGLHHRDERATDRHARAIEGVDMAHLAALLGTIARIHAPRLELAAQRTRRNLAI